MRAAIEESDAGDGERQELHAYMTLAADAMINIEPPTDTSQRAVR